MEKRPNNLGTLAPLPVSYRKFIPCAFSFNEFDIVDVVLPDNADVDGETIKISCRSTDGVTFILNMRYSMYSELVNELSRAVKAPT
jgi:hypothetical protein